MFYSPAKLAVGGVLTWFVVWLLTPVDVVGNVAVGPVVYAALGYLALIIGALLGGDPILHSDRPPTVSGLNQPLRRDLFWITAALGLLGIVLRVFDRLFLRGIEYGMNALELREALSSTSSSWAGISAAVLFPLCLIPLMLLLASRDRGSRPLLLLSAIIFILPMAESLFQLSRSFMILTLGLGFATIVITRYRGRAFNRRLMTVAALGVIGLLAVSTVIFSARIEAGYGRLTDSIYDSVYANFLRPNAAAQEAVSTGSDAAAFATLAVLPNGMYYISGAYEFTALWLRPDDQEFAYGQMHLYPFVRVVYSVLDFDGLSEERVANYVYRDGVFQTFFGPLWVDFGWLGPILLLPFGYVVALLSTAVRAGSIAVLPIYVYLTIVVFFMPVVNFLISGFGMLSVTSFIIFALLASSSRSSATAPESSRKAATT